MYPNYINDQFLKFIIQIFFSIEKYILLQLQLPMIAISFRLFFLDPLIEIYQGLLSYLKFIFKFIIDTVFLKNISGKKPDDLLEETFKIFKTIIFLIIANIAINEIYNDIDSDLWHEFKSEGAYLAFFYISFLGIYYTCRLYEKLTSNNIHKVIVLRYLLFVVLATAFLYQVDGIMNPDIGRYELINDIAIKDLVSIFLIFSGMVLVHWIYLLMKKRIKWFDLFYYLVMTALIFLFIVINGVIILMINGLK